MTDDPRQTWALSAEGVAYPPEPWHLGASMRASLFGVPVAELPAEVSAYVPPDHRRVVVGGRAVLAVAFARYLPGGVLTYDELLVALLVRRGVRLRLSVPLIWVDSESSQHGGRELWGIPKRLATFADDVVAADGVEIARLRSVDGRLASPVRLPVPLPTAQWHAGRRIVSQNVVFGRPRALRASWRFAPEGPLGFLAGRSPLLSTAATDAALVFGADVHRSS